MTGITPSRTRSEAVDHGMDSVKQEVRFTDKHLGRSAEVIAGG